MSEILDISRVVWIGGGSGAGKTSVAMSLAFRYDLAFYRIDARAYEHRDRLIERGLVDDDPEKSHDLRWLEPDPADMAQGFVDTSRHLIPLILDDLSALDPKVGVVVEGPQLFPSLVAPYLASPRHGAWLLPTPEFRRRALESRSTGAAKFTRDPERALENLLTRNALLDAQTRAEGETLDLRLFEVDGSDDPPTMAERVGAHLCVAQLPSAHNGEQRSAMRRYENDAMVNNVRAFLSDTGQTELSGTLPFCCECERLGCAETVPLPLGRYEELRADGRPVATAE